LQFQAASVFSSSVRLEYSKRGGTILALTGREIEQIYSFDNVRIASQNSRSHHPPVTFIRE
ncbi:MAG: hypothetical protein VX576_00795, partial [Pseudomonadota bacterium]|nr:hypothetical protein [Pseudomonadota bacterium]